MAIRDGLIAEYEREIAVTRKLFTASQALSLDWRPHDKSRSLGELVVHLAGVPAWGARILDRIEYDVDLLPAAMTPSLPAEIAVTFDAHAATTRRLLEKTDAEWLAVWRLNRGDDELFSMPRTTAFRRFVLSHLIHHRGQLSVYLRMAGAPVPAIYGNSADEPFPT